jgi:hypothetical protein
MFRVDLFISIQGNYLVQILCAIGLKTVLAKCCGFQLTQVLFLMASFYDLTFSSEDSN